MSHSSSRLPQSLREALVTALQMKLPPGQPMTLDAIERATGELLRELGPQMMEDLIHGVESDPKKGALLSASTATAPPPRKA